MLVTSVLLDIILSMAFAQFALIKVDASLRTRASLVFPPVNFLAASALQDSTLTTECAQVASSKARALPLQLPARQLVNLFVARVTRDTTPLMEFADLAMLLPTVTFRTKFVRDLNYCAPPAHPDSITQKEFAQLVPLKRTALPPERLAWIKRAN